jgi:ATP-dependent RNA helicase RhlE
MQFSDLRLSTPILRALEQEGYKTPTPIQQQTIPPALTGRDVLGCARTGTGKTAAFALPIIDRLSKAPIDKSRRGPRKARALVLSPTRELAAQIGDSFAAYGRETPLDCTVIFGGVSQFHQERALRRGVDIIVATPGRLIDLMEQRLVDLTGIEVFVLDEADRMLDMGFIDPIRRIASATPAANRQTLMFSATMPKPILHLAQSLLRNPVKIEADPVASTVPAIDQRVFMVEKTAKQGLLEHLLSDVAAQRALVFTRTKHGADKVGRKLAQVGIRAETIHGNKSQPQRRKALERFSTGAARVLVATDVAARGLDVDDISHVFNFDLPVEPEAYVHRIGRTGRAGATGIAVSFCGGDERGLLREIEKLMGKKIEVQGAPAGYNPRANSPAPSHPNDAPGPIPQDDYREAQPRHRSSRARSQGTPRQGGRSAPRPAENPRASMNAWRKPSRRAGAR